MKIDPTFRNIIPPLGAEELSQLEANIIADGCRDPLVTWEGTLIDGHNRYDICMRHGLPFKSVAMEFPDRDAVLVWIIRNQFGRRNLAPFTRGELALKLEPLIAAKAKLNQKTGGGALVLKLAQAPMKTRDELARLAGLSHDPTQPHHAATTAMRRHGPQLAALRQWNAASRPALATPDKVRRWRDGDAPRSEPRRSRADPRHHGDSRPRMVQTT